MRDSVALSYVHIVMWHKYRGTDHTHSNCACKIAADMCMTKILLYNWDRRCSVECRKVAGVRSVTDKFWYIDHLHCSIFQSLMRMFLSLSGCTYWRKVGSTSQAMCMGPWVGAHLHLCCFQPDTGLFSETTDTGLVHRVVCDMPVYALSFVTTKLYCLVTGEQGCEQHA